MWHLENFYDFKKVILFTKDKQDGDCNIFWYFLLSYRRKPCQAANKLSKNMDDGQF